MLRRLIVMRHAKSDWGSAANADHDRPLNERGRRDAPRVARELVTQGWQPTHVVSSDSKRTRQTYELMEPHFTQIPVVDFFPSLYHAGLAELAHVVGELPDAVETVLALGHNPGWESVVQTLAGQPQSMTTANAALLSLPSDHWSEAIVRKGVWELHAVIRPKELES